MKADDFRRLALELDGACESAHMNHPDFRVGGKIFASLGYPDEAWAMVALTPEQQRTCLAEAPKVFMPCKGAWGARGATNVQLGAARVGQVRPALQAAHANVVAKVRKSRPK